MQTQITLQQLSIGYGGSAPKPVLSGICATVPPGRLTCLIGTNGVGKSTLLRTLAAFQPALSGEVLIDGKPITQYSRRELARKIGVVLTERTASGTLTAFEVAAMGRSPYTGFFGTLSTADRQTVTDSLRLVGIESLAQRSIATLSDGERQKVMIAKALAQQTSVIFLDEPTAFLDYGSKVDVMRLLHRLCQEQGHTIFLSTHDIELALQTADHLWVMTPQGITTGTPRQLAHDGTLATFINRPGVVFHPQDMTVRVEP